MNKPLKKVITYQYIELFPCLDYLEAQRPGIRHRVWHWLIELKKYDGLVNDGMSHLNLFYFGPKDEKDQAAYAGVFDWVQEDPQSIELQQDIHLLWSEFAQEGDDIEQFYFTASW